MPKINAAWHDQHPMPKNATLDQRVTWHLAHVKACACREIPRTILDALKARGLAVPRPTRR
jgi:hypothetical protein